MAEWAIYWSPAARADLRDIVEYIAARGDGANAARIFERLVARVERLATQPQRGHRPPEFELATEPPLLEIIERPWRILYGCERGRVVVVAIVDDRRDVAAALKGRLWSGFADIP